MGKPLNKAQIQLKKVRRLKSKTLESLLLYRFLNHYGYDKGEITARAIVDDVLRLIDEYFLVTSLDDDLHCTMVSLSGWRFRSMNGPAKESPWPKRE